MSIITDAKGRKLETRDFTVLDQVRLLRAIGPGQSSNEPYVNIVQMAASVASIDGVPCPMVKNEKDIDAAIARVGDEGFSALLVDMKRQVDVLTAAAEEAAEGAPSPLVQ